MHMSDLIHDDVEPHPPCHSTAAEFEGRCYLPQGHDGDHVYQPVLFDFIGFVNEAIEDLA